MNIELIRKLQKNTTVFGELPEEERKCLEENKEHVEVRDHGNWNNDIKSEPLHEWLTYRIDPSWNPVPEPAEWIRDRFEVYEIVRDGYGRLAILFKDDRVIPISSLIDLPDFVGCVFEEDINQIIATTRAFANRDEEDDEEELVWVFGESSEYRPITAKWAVFAR